ncbi:IS110 family transposase [Serratia marcescens]|uniref:IS110 family transposase n=1 Tax=Serratia marcescens TaxID=615 RepID=UPI002237EAED|nr:IS110 family transposase [Serratia marcescens]MCW6016656.1 IS110 family transposase [Serratia marcescens]MCW6023195.1 IS110 family transposase [Serratia marcescens]
MENVALVGIDIGKNTFHIHAQDRTGHCLTRKKFNRAKLYEFLVNLSPTTIVMEACGGAHYLARRLTLLGHKVKLLPAQFVKPFVKSNKNDFIDAEAICEAASRPNMRFVTPKTESQQQIAVLHCVRDALVRDRVRTVNQMHGFLLEFGISLPKASVVKKVIPILLEDETLPPVFVKTLRRMLDHHRYLSDEITEIEKEIEELLAGDELGHRLLSIPGVGLITASVLATELGDGKHYANSRCFASAVGLVPRQYSTGGKTKLLGISKRGNKNLRRLLVQCARAFMARLEYRKGALADWVRDLCCRRHKNVVACALANKLARISWALINNRSYFDNQELVIE